MCLSLYSVMSNSLQSHGLQPARFHCPWSFPGQNIGVGHHFLHQGIFSTQGSNQSLLHLLHWQANSLPLHHLGSPLIRIKAIKQMIGKKIKIIYHLSKSMNTVYRLILKSRNIKRNEDGQLNHSVVYIKVKRVYYSVMSDSLQPHGLQPTRLLSPWDSPGKNTLVGSHYLLGTQGSNLGLLHCRQILYCLSHQRSPEGTFK